MFFLFGVAFPPLSVARLMFSSMAVGLLWLRFCLCCVLLVSVVMWCVCCCGGGGLGGGGCGGGGGGPGLLVSWSLGLFGLLVS